MTADDLAELDAVLAAYHAAMAPEHSRNSVATARRQLETLLVRHAGVLLEAAKLAHAMQVLQVTEVSSVKLAEYEPTPGNVEVWYCGWDHWHKRCLRLDCRQTGPCRGFVA